jgi:hypothetical protein
MSARSVWLSFEVSCGEGVGDALGAARADDSDDVTLGGAWARTHAMASCASGAGTGSDGLQSAGNGTVSAPVVAVQTRQVRGGAHVVCAEPSGQQPVAEDAVGGDPDSDLAAGGDDGVLWRLNSEYSISTSLIKCTALARRMVCPLTADRRMARTYPAWTSSAIAPTVSSTGTAGSSRAGR